VRAFFASVFGYFLSPFGLLLLAALDTSMLFFLPFAVDAAVILLSAHRPEWVLLYAGLATAGSVIGAAGTFWIGRRAGEHGLERFVSRRRLASVKHQVRDRGAVALAVPSLVPPPFPFTPFILACGALDVSRTRFFVTFAAMRMLRFTAEGWLASVYGRQILTWMKSTTFQAIVVALAVVAVAGTVAGIWMYFRHGGGAAATARPA